MDGEKFDDLLKRLCTTRLTRISALRGLAAGAAAVLTGATLASDDTDAKKKKRGGGKKGRGKKGGANKGGAGDQNSKLRIATAPTACACADDLSPKACPTNAGPPYFTCKAVESGAGCGVRSGNPPKGSIQVGCEGNNQPFCFCNSTACVVNPGTPSEKKFKKGDRVGDLAGGTCKPVTCPSASCDDNNLCTKDTCNQTTGFCEHVEKDCSRTEGVDECNEGFCNEEDGSCQTRPTPNVECDDDLFCTEGDVCVVNEAGRGVCRGQRRRDCSRTEGVDECNEGFCNEDADACQTRPTPNVECDDDLFCTEGDVCVVNEAGRGVCRGQRRRDCSRTEGVDECNEGFCNEDADACQTRPTPNVECDDDLFCTEGDVCVVNEAGRGVCRGQRRRDCSRTEGVDECNEGFCNEDADACQTRPTPNVECDDDLFCTEGDVCVVNEAGRGVCRGQRRRDCSRTEGVDECNEGFCNEDADACQTRPTPNVECDDDLFCTEGDVCVVNEAGRGVCRGQRQRDCADTIRCTADSCNETLGICEHVPTNSLCPPRTGCDAICDPVNGDANGCRYENCICYHSAPSLEEDPNGPRDNCKDACVAATQPGGCQNSCEAVCGPLCPRPNDEGGRPERQCLDNVDACDSSCFECVGGVAHFKDSCRA